MKCPDKHTVFQPTEDEWKCPTCDSGHDYFYVYETYGLENCELLHRTDFVVCDKCKGEWTGAEIAKMLLQKNSAVVCPHCKGTGRLLPEPA